MGVDYDQVLSDFEFLDDWEDRYRYVIELGRKLDPLPEEARTPQNKVHGCVSQVWLETTIDQSSGEPVLSFRGDSDAHIVRGLVAILLSIFSGHSAREILEIDAKGKMAALGLDENLSRQRANGLNSMIERIRNEARQALAADGPGKG